MYICMMLLLLLLLLLCCVIGRFVVALWRAAVRVGCGCCGFCRYIYIDIDGGSERKDREEKKEKKRKEKKGRIRVCGRGNKP